MTTRPARLLVPIDVNGCAADVVERASWLARMMRAEIVLMVAYEEPAGAPSEAHVFIDGKDTTIEAFLADELRADLAPHVRTVARADIPLLVDIRHGAATRAILTACAELAPDLLVMGTHGRTGLRRLVFGSVAEAVLHASPCPILVVPAGRGLEERPSPAMRQLDAESSG